MTAGSPDEALLLRALERGYLTAPQAAAVRAQLGQGSSALEILGRYLLPEHLRELRILLKRGSDHRMLAAFRDSSAPARVGDYVIERELARGGMGIVYVGRHETLGRRVAIKRMLSGKASLKAELRFEAEGQLGGRLNHPGIVKVHEVGVSGEDPYMVMDFVEGESLADRIDREGPLPIADAARIAAELARAMAHAHEHGVLHRDLKPANVLLDASGRALITDFGLAKALSEERERLTRTGQIVGTPAYMPPEQAKGDLPAIGPQSDVYGLGAVLYAMLTGQAPFENPSMLALVANVISAPPLPVRELRSDCPAALEAIALECLAKQPQDRYPSAGALADDLARFQGGQRVQARRAAPRLALATAAVVVVGAILAGLAASSDQDPDPAATGVDPASVASALPPPRPDESEPTSPAEVRWRALRELEDPLPAARAWLAEFEGAPHTDDVRELLRAAYGKPLAQLKLTAAAGARFLSEDRAVLARRSSKDSVLTYYWTLGDEKAERWKDPKGIQGAYRCLAVSRENDRFAIGTNAQTAFLYSISKGERTRRFFTKGAVRSVAFSRAGEWTAVSAYETDLAVYETRTGKRVARFKDTLDKTGMAMSRDGRFVAAYEDMARGNWIDVWTVEPKKKLARFIVFAQPTCLAFAPDGATFVVGDNHGKLTVFDTRTGDELKKLQGVQDKATAQQQQFLAGKQRPAHSSEIREVQFSGDGARLYSLDLGAERSAEVAAWDVNRGEEVGRLSLDLQGCGSLDLSPDGERLLITSAASNRVVVWSVVALELGRGVSATQPGE